MCLDLKFGAHMEDRHILDKFEGQGHRSKVKVNKVENLKIPVFSLVADDSPRSRSQGSRSRSPRSKVKVKGRRSRSQD